jgi:FtsP/CotA-like multicopper oxidase with cupredoxin domain
MVRKMPGSDVVNDKSVKKPARIAYVAIVFALLFASVSAVVAWTQFSGSTSAETPGVEEFFLTAKEVDWELQPGTTVKAWTYNGTVPGPEIRVKEGDLVRVHLKNELPAATTIHWHGVDVPAAMDGPAGLNQAPVEPGETFTYEFIATPGGTRWYHSHTDVSTQVLLGLYGAFIVEPKDEKIEADRDYTYILSEWDNELTPEVAMGLKERGPRDMELRGGEWGTDEFLFNGKMHEAISPIVVDQGDTVRIRLINAGNLAHPFHIHGHSFKIVATDGNPVPEGAQLTKDTVLIAPGERYDLVFEANNPGVWMVHCHIENHADNGMMTVIQYEGALPSGPLKEVWGAEGEDQMAPMHGPDVNDVSSSGDAQQADAGMSGMDHGSAQVDTPEQPAEVLQAADETIVTLADNRFVPRQITVKAGTKLTFENKGANWHSVAGAGGLISSGQIGAGQSYTVVIDTPGEYNIVCRHHLRQGMTATLTVTE